MAHGHTIPSLRPLRTRAAALIVTLWIVLAIAGVVLVFARTVRVDTLATANAVAAMQAEAVARGGLQYVLARLDGRKGVPPTEADVPCEMVPVGDGFFWVLRPPRTDEVGPAFGIVDEAGKLGLNAATAEMLLKLPGMTADVAAAVVDWRDSDSAVTPEGAESDYYLLLPEPYNCKNGPFETLEELLLVRGVTKALLFGRDLNRNGVLDAAEAVAPGSLIETGDSQSESGIAPFVTPYSVEPNADANGGRRVDVNAGGGALAGVLRSALSGERLATVLVAAQGNRPFRNVLDFYVRSGLTATEFAAVADRLTTRRERTLLGLVDVSTAPKEVLLCLPGLEASDADALVAKRAAGGVELNTIAWVADAIPREKAVGIGDAITARSYQYSADIVGVSGDGRAFKRFRAVIDTRTSPLRVIYWKDLTRLGWPLAPEIRSTLRQNAGASKESA